MGDTSHLTFFEMLGIYTDVHARPRNDIVTTGVVTQVVYLTKTVTIRGGYSTNLSAWDPAANPITPRFPSPILR